MKRYRPALALSFVLPFLLFSLHTKGEDEKDIAETLKSCPPVPIGPLVERKSIVIKHEHFGEGKLYFYPGIVLVHLYGTPYERGYQHGAMQKAEIEKTIKLFRKARPGPMEALKTISFYRELRDRSEGLRQELLGMADGAEISVWELVWLNRAYMKYGPPKKDDDPPAAFSSAPSFDVSEESRRLWQAAGMPGWTIFVHHPEALPEYVVLSRPGAVFAMAGMRRTGCCLSEEGVFENREGLGKGLCGAAKSEVQTNCMLSFFEGEREIKAYFFGGTEVVCFSRDKGQSFGALDMETYTWRPRCPACSGMVEELSNNNEGT